jgi:hypothetical protein
MQLRIAGATHLLVVAAAACAGENPLAPKSPPSVPMKDGGNWMGSGH